MQGDGAQQDPIARRVRIVGRVQGVGFRAFVRAKARERGLVGWVRNLPDGRSLEAHLEGPRGRVEEVLAELLRGPAWARVDSHALQPAEPEGGQGFEVRA